MENPTPTDTPGETATVVTAADVAFRFAYILLATAAIGLTVAFVLNITEAPVWVFRQYNTMQWSVLAHLVALVVFCLVLAGRMPRLFFNIVFAAILAAMYASARVVPLGDHDLWIRAAAGNQLPGSEILAMALYAAAQRAGIGLDYVPIAIGTVSGFLYLQVCDHLLASGGNLSARRAKILAGLLYLGSGVQLLFFRQYVENTPPSIPFLLLYVFFAVSYLRGRRRGFDWNLSFSALALLLACMTHGQNVFLTPSLAILIVLRRLLRKQYLASLRDVGASVGLAAGVFAGIYYGLQALGFHILQGNIRGGGDKIMFVPLHDVPSPWVDFTFFSVSHLLQLSNTIVLVCPVAAMALVLGLRSSLAGCRAGCHAHAGVSMSDLLSPDSNTWPRGGCHGHATHREGLDEHLFLVILGLGYLGFACLWNFDLGFPGDYDLMTSMGILLLPAATAATVRSGRWPAGLALAAIGLPYAWGTIFLFLRP